MKKKFLLLGLCLAVLFVSCSTPTNNNTTKEEDKKTDMSFLNDKSITTLPDEGFTPATWISITQTTGDTEGVFFILVEDTTITKYGLIDGIKSKPQNMSYTEFIKAKTSNKEQLQKAYPYWCKITSEFYETHKNSLPSYLKNNN